MRAPRQGPIAVVEMDYNHELPLGERSRMANRRERAPRARATFAGRITLLWTSRDHLA
jgi:hypothetical protein